MFGYCRSEVTLSFLWIFATTEVQAYFNDGLNPVRVDLSVWHQRNPRVALRTNDQLTCEKPNIYICEEPPNIVPSEIGKACNFRNVQYHEQVYRWVAGRGCLLYTPDFLFVNGSNPINLNAGCFYGNLFAPCLEIVKDDGTCGCYPFDPALEEVAKEVRNALIPTAHGRWEKCFYEASDCCSHFMEDTSFAELSNEECPTTFDGWTCWHPAVRGTTASAVCSEFAYSNSGPSCNHYSTKRCFNNGTWELQTDYATCSITPRLLSRYRFYIGMLAFSVVACIPAIFIFFFYKRLRITRVVMHRNLLLAIVIRNLLVIIARSEIYIQELKGSGSTTMSRNSVLCRILSTGERAAAGAVFAAMLLEGLYLHRLIVAVFRRRMELAYLYLVAAAIAILPVLVWATIMALYNDHSCWVVYTVDHVQWILDGPRILILLVNTVLFIDVLRVLLTKIRNTENSNQLSTVKATLFLMPVFGTQFIFTAIRPTTSDCAWEQVYYFIAYAMEGLQGFMVSLIYCYANREVHGLIKATYKKTESAVVSRIRGSDVPRTSVDPKSDRRFTYTTGISKNTEEKDPYTYMKPKLHVAEIISIQASERLAEILEPVYETVDNGLVNSGYDFLDRSDYENDYNFTNASSVSIGCQDWLRRTSPNSSIYNKSVIDTTKPKIKENDDNEAKIVKEKESEYENDPKSACPKFNTEFQTEDVYEIPSDNDYENHDMLNEIIQYIESNERNLALNSELLAPNRKPEDKIVFVDQ